jgi:type IV pilus assembly protein PilB
MGIETFNLASSLSLIIAQRLGRRLCPHCKEEDPVTAIQRKELGLNRGQVMYRAHKGGCTECTGGYSGRIGIYEVMKFDARMANAVAKGASIAQLETVARHCGMLTLRESGIEKLREGITSYAELQRVLYL